MTLIHEPDYGTPPVESATTARVTIDGREVTVPAGTSVMRAAKEAGIGSLRRCPSSMSACERPWLGDRWPVPGVAGSIRPESCMRRPGKVGFPPWLWARSSRTECL